ncbi:MAG: tetratricopeptide repeat protein, partial [Bacteroidales bacterium]
MILHILINKRFSITGIALFSLLAGITGNNLSSSGEADSLKKLVTGKNNDSEKSELLLNLSSYYYSRNILDSAEYFCLQASAVSNDINDKTGIIDSYYRLGLIYNRRGDFVMASERALKSLNLAKPLNDSLRLTRINYLYGMALSNQGKNDSALFYYRESYLMAKQMGDIQRLIALYNGTGNIYQGISVYDSAAFYYLKAIRLCEEYNYHQFLGMMYNNLGKTLNLLGEYDESLRYLKKSLEINRKSNFTKDIALSLTNIGIVYYNMLEDDSARSYYDQAMELLKTAQLPHELANLYVNYGVLHLKKNENDKALVNFRKALDYYYSWNYSDGIAIGLMNIGRAYSNLGKYQQAYAVMDSALEVSRESRSLVNQQDIYYHLSENAYKAGNYKTAYEYYILQTDLKDSIYTLESTRLINDLKLAYEREQDQTQILSLKNLNLEMALDLQRQKSQLNAALFTGIGIIVLALFLLLYFRQLSRKDKIIAKQKIQQLEEEKKLLAARLLVEGQEEERKRIARELHDGLGVLLSATKLQFTSIKDKSPENKPLIEKATQLLEQASNDVRKISHNMMPGLLTKLGLYEATADLIERINETENINARFQISGKKSRLPENKEIMLYRIVQELVNNTLKHARAGKIELTIETSPDTLRLHYMDDGVGFDVQKLLDAETGSFGLKSLQSRAGYPVANSAQPDHCRASPANY